MIKLIVSDVDGTLVPEGTNQMHPGIFSMIRKLKKQGIYFAVASGRHKCSIEKLFAPVRDDILYITSNGAYMGTYSKKFAVSALSANIYTRLFKDFRKLAQFPFLAESIRTAYTDCPDPEFTRLLTEDYDYDMTLLASMDDCSDEIIKLSLYHPENVRNISPDLLKQWSEISKCSISGTHWIDFMAPDTNKGTALARLQEILGITIHETLAFGDQITDIEMLKQAYFSYAMGNACGDVKNAARFTCDACEKDGVLNTLSQFFPE